MRRGRNAVGGAASRFDRGVKVVVEHRHVVRVRGRLRFLEAAARVTAAGEHAVTVPGGTIAYFVVCHGSNIESVRPWPALISSGHVAAQLTESRSLWSMLLSLPMLHQIV
jgi:hypothetical protein